MTSSSPQVTSITSRSDATSENTFTLFPLLPSELRVKIWKFCFTPRRVIIRHIKDRYKLDPFLGNFIFVSFEAREVFFQSYTRCFHSNSPGVGAMWVNFEIDTLCFRSGVRTLKAMLRRYPREMNMARWIDVTATSREGGPSDNEEPRTETLTGLSALALITVRVDFLGHCQQYSYDLWKEDWLTRVAERIRNALLRGQDPKGSYAGPRLAIFFPSTAQWREDIYLETGNDLNHASYGTMAWNGLSPREERALLIHSRADKSTFSPTDLDNFRVHWARRNEAWSTSYQNDIFTRMAASRTPYTRQGLRDFWTSETASYLFNALVNMADQEYYAMRSEERSALSQAEDEWSAAIDLSPAWKDFPFVPKPVHELDGEQVSPGHQLCLYARSFKWTNTQDAVDRLLDVARVIRQQTGLKEDLVCSMAPPHPPVPARWDGDVCAYGYYDYEYFSWIN